jgi:hypothetical protein
MKRLNQIHQKLSLCLFTAVLMIGSPALAAISLPTAVEFEKAISFQKPDGEPVQLKAGIYEVKLGAEEELKFDPIGAGDVITVAALPANHDEAFEHAKALLTPAPDNNPDKQHVILWMPDGVAMEAIGSYSGLFSRSTLTWGTTEEGKKADAQEPLTVNFEKSLYFKTAGGEPKILKPGDYEVGFADDGMVLTPVGGKPEDAITIESESLGTSAAVALPEFDGNPNLELLVLATVGGQSIIAIGSQDGTFPRGLGSFVKKLGGGIKKAAKFSYGKAKRHVGRHVRKAAITAGRAVKKHGARYARNIGKKALNMGLQYGTKVLGGAAMAAAMS